MKYPVTTQGPFAIVSLTGEVDLHTSPNARQQILDQLNAGQSVLVDLSQVEYIDSSGIASLVEGLRVAKGGSQRFGLVGVSKPAMQVLQLAKLDRVFPIFDSVADGIAEAN
jgi:anti-sigma B factor antagonist